MANLNNDAKKTDDKIKIILRELENKGVPVLEILDITDLDSLTRGKFIDKFVNRSIILPGNEVITKLAQNSFIKTLLEAELRKEDVQVGIHKTTEEINSDIPRIIEEINRINDKKYTSITGEYSPAVFTKSQAYYFINIMQKLYPGGIMLMRHNSNGYDFAIQIGDEIYDANGLIEDTADFHTIENEDFNVIEHGILSQVKEEREVMNLLVDSIYNDIYDEIYNGLLDKEKEDPQAGKGPKS